MRLARLWKRPSYVWLKGQPHAIGDIGHRAIIAGHHDQLENCFLGEAGAQFGPERVADRNSIMQFIRQSDQQAVVRGSSGVIRLAIHAGVKLGFV
jgi:hypothetical protein